MTAFHGRILALLTAFACFGVLTPVSAADYDKGAKVSEGRDWGWKDRGWKRGGLFGWRDHDRKDWGWKRADRGWDRGWRDHGRDDRGWKRGGLFGWRDHDRKDWGWKRADWGWKDRGWRHHDRADWGTRRDRQASAKD